MNNHWNHHSWHPSKLAAEPNPNPHPGNYFSYVRNVWSYEGLNLGRKFSNYKGDCRPFFRNKRGRQSTRQLSNQYRFYELGQPRCWLFVWSAPLNIAYWDVFFLHRFDHAPTNTRKTHLFIFLDLFEGYDRYNDPKKYNNGHNLLLSGINKNKKGVFSVCFCTYMRFQFEVHFLNRNSQNWAGHRRKTHISRSYLFSVRKSHFGKI